MNRLSSLTAAFNRGKKPKVRAAHPDAAFNLEKNPMFLRMSVKEKVMFVKQLSILIKSGIPIMTAMQMISKQSGSRSTSHIMRSLLIQVENGDYLSKGMGRFRNIFGDFSINLVRVGEISGTLNENLHYLADELKKKQELRRKVISALVYPAFIVIATLGITVLLTVYVFPKIMPIFNSFKFQLPWSTRLLIAVSSGMQHYWYYFLIGVVVAVAAIMLLMRWSVTRLWLDRNSLRLPLFGSLIQSYQIANFTRTLGLLLKSDVRIVEALSIVASTTSNLAYRKAFEQIGESVTRGEKIFMLMEKNERLFPSIVSQMIAVGEATGKLSDSLLYLSETQEDEVNNITKDLSTSIEPILMIFMGILVGFIAISIITPIYGITQNLHP